MERFRLSVVSPVYKAEKIVDELVRRIKEELDRLEYDFDYEIVLVEDGSPDNSWVKIAENCDRYGFVKGIKLSRNFGQHAATEAGLANADGDYIVLMDCDLQDDPGYIGALLEKCFEGADVVLARKNERKHSGLKNLQSSIFSRIFSMLSSSAAPIIYDSRIGTFSLITRKVKEAYLSIGDLYKPYTGMIGWVGFKQAYIEIDHKDRYEGKSSYTFFKSVSHALNGIIGYTDKLLYMSIYIGAAFVGLSGLYGFYIILSTLFYGHGTSGWTSLIVAIIFSSGMILINLGICSLYIAKIFEQSKKRPKYIVERALNN